MVIFVGMKRGRDWLDRSAIGRLVRYVTTRCYTPEDQGENQAQEVEQNEALDTSSTCPSKEIFRRDVSVSAQSSPEHSEDAPEQPKPDDHFRYDKYRQRQRMLQEDSMDIEHLSARVEDVKRILQEMTSYAEAPVVKRAKVQTYDSSFQAFTNRRYNDELNKRIVLNEEKNDKGELFSVVDHKPHTGFASEPVLFAPKPQVSSGAPKQDAFPASLFSTEKASFVEKSNFGSPIFGGQNKPFGEAPKVSLFNPTASIPSTSSLFPSIPTSPPAALPSTSSLFPSSQTTAPGLAPQSLFSKPDQNKPPSPKYTSAFPSQADQLLPKHSLFGQPSKPLASIGGFSPSFPAPAFSPPVPSPALSQPAQKPGIFTKVSHPFFVQSPQEVPIEDEGFADDDSGSD
mmetsp:Transcript_5947/g.10549  ORF Transcript_5947/g.10549 Transcript_5947/m.10549 type:complete len:399 (-) Transcript_5947:37-1233(-)